MPTSRSLGRGLLRLQGGQYLRQGRPPGQLVAIQGSSPVASIRVSTQLGSVRQLVRPFSSTPSASHGHVGKPKPGEELWVTFIDKEGQEHKIAASKGDNLLDIAQANDLEMEGACGGSCACSTCHVIVLDEEYYDKMPEPEDDENDMLDMAFGLTETSRLGCQITMTKELDGLRVRLPSMTRNLQASDFQSKKNADGTADARADSVNAA